MGRARGIGVIISVLAALYFGLGHESQYVFNPETMKSIGQQAVTSGGGNMTAVAHHVEALLRQHYPRYIVAHPPWLFNNAGGAMGAMYVLHCSFTEYVIIFGTAVGTEGHSGRFLADDFFTILHGEQWAALPGQLERSVYKPGDQNVMLAGVTKQYRCPQECWALEYARGNIASMLPFGVADSLFSTMDFYTLGATVWVTFYNMIFQLVTNGKI